MKYFILFLTFISCSPKNSSYIKLMEKFREHYKQEFLLEERAPLKTKDEVDLLDFFPIDKNYECHCKVIEAQEKTAFEMTTYSGISKPYYAYGILECQLQNKIITLQIYQSVKQSLVPEYKNLLFLPFKDETNDDTTYGGGRYIDLDKNDIIDNEIIVDFNKSYNPYCAYTDGYNCPIPPKPNHLSIKIEAGEKKYLGQHLNK